MQTRKLLLVSFVALLSMVTFSKNLSKGIESFRNSGDVITGNSQVSQNSSQFLQNLMAKSQANPDFQFTDASGQAWGQTGWSWLNPLPQGNSLGAVKFISSTTGWTAGDYGTILKTQDGGNSWQLQLSGTTNILLGMCFTNADTGTVVGAFGTILRTTNGGRNWLTQIGGLASPITFRSVSFSDANTGTIVGDLGTILRTTDGGTTWTQQVSGTSNTLFGVAFTNSNTGTAVGTLGTILRTTNGGTTWAAQTSGTTYSLMGVSFYDTNIGSAVGGYGRILSTTNGGSTWSTQTVATITLSCVLYLNANTCTASGQNGVVFKTTNGWTNWIQVSATSKAVSSISFSDLNNGTAVGALGEIIRSTDGGTTWQKQTSGIRETLTRIFFADESNGMALSSNSIYMSSNGGVSWVATSSGIQFNGCTSSSATSWTVVGNAGKIMKSTDGGGSWNSQTSNTIFNLYSVAFPNATTGIVVGANGIIRKTTNGGTNWLTCASGTTESLMAVCFTDVNNGTAVGTNGKILKTTNGGTAWSVQSSGTTCNLIDVCFIDANHGEAVGYDASNNKVFLSTSNGGTTWTLQTLGMSIAPTNISFTDANNGWIVAGYIYRTTDGGTTWSQMQTPAYGLTSITKTSSGSGYVLYAGGSNGTVLVSAISPLGSRTWTWTGGQDSSWNNSANWNPSGIPVPGDSVVIGASSQNPVIYLKQQQLTVGALSILSGGKLTITDSLASLHVLGDVEVLGTLEVRQPATTYIEVGGNWIITPTLSSDKGFIPGYSEVNFKGSGIFSRDFYTIQLDTASALSSAANISVQNNLINYFGTLQLTHTGASSKMAKIEAVVKDTLFVESDSPQALVNSGGEIASGVICRKINASSTDLYQFGTKYTYVKFQASSLHPARVLINDFPNTTPTDFGTDWVEVASTVDTINHVITANGITSFGTWGIGTSSGAHKTIENLKNIQNTPKVKHVYTGGTATSTTTSKMINSGYDFTLSLQYASSEVPAGVSEGSLVLMKLKGPVITASVKVIPQGYYDTGTNRLRQRDSVWICLANAAAPYAIVDSARTILDSLTLTATAKLSTAASGSYYLVIRHRNCIETWSANSITFTQGSTVSYDFTDSASKAYGSNETNDYAGTTVAGVYSMYTGDANQDGYVDPLDLSLIDQDSFNYVSGCGLATDLNGDNYIDPLDLSMADQGSFNYVGVRRPATAGRIGRPVKITNVMIIAPELLLEKRVNRNNQKTESKVTK